MVRMLDIRAVWQAALLHVKCLWSGLTYHARLFSYSSHSSLVPLFSLSLCHLATSLLISCLRGYCSDGVKPNTLSFIDIDCAFLNGRLRFRFLLLYFSYFTSLILLLIFYFSYFTSLILLKLWISHL